MESFTIIYEKSDACSEPTITYFALQEFFYENIYYMKGLMPGLNELSCILR